MATRDESPDAGREERDPDRSPESELAGRYESILHDTIRGTLRFYALANVVLLVVRVVGHRYEFVLLHLLGMAASLGLARLIRPGLSQGVLRWVFHATAALLTLSLAALSAVAGGSQAPAMFILAAVPLLLGLAVGLRGALFWSAVNALIVLLALLGPPASLLPSRERVVTQILFSLGLGAVGVFLRRSMLRYIEELLDRDRRLQQQARELTLARDEALRASQVKGDFLASMSHELRTPLHAVLASAELLRETPLSDEQREHMAVLTTGSRALLTVIGDILDLSKLEANKLTLLAAPFELRECVEDAVALVRPQAEAKGLALAVSLDPGLPRVVCGDPERLRQILLNLLSNAVKFTAEGQVSLRGGPGLRPGEARFEVQDTGPGIASDQRDKLFQAFSQIDGSRTRRHGGTGLGLAISRQLVERMGGAIGVESEPGQGARFFFVILLPETDQPPLRSPRSAPAVAASPRPLRLVVAEDNPVNQLVITRLLARLGHTARVADDGQKALDLLAREPCDVLLLDVQMPVLDGLGVARALGQLPARPYIIGLTANASTDDRAACLAAGMDDFLTKPVDLTTLRRALDQASSRPAPAATPSR